MSALERARRLLKEGVDFIEELVAEAKILGETPEEQEKTLKLMQGMTPAEIQEALREYRERHGVSAP